MSNIPYPDVPNYDGVPDIPRESSGTSSISISVASGQEGSSSTSSYSSWGIYTQSGDAIYTPTEGGTLSVLSFGMTKSMAVSSFPVEANNTNQGASFASFNKVYQPINPVITYSLSGTSNEKSAFLTAVDDACESTTIYNVFMPDADYSAPDSGCTVERYSYNRTAATGATLLIVEVSLKQAKQVTAQLSNSSISSAQSPSSSAKVNNGNTQTSTAQTSWLAQIATGNLVGVK